MALGLILPHLAPSCVPEPPGGSHNLRALRWAGWMQPGHAARPSIASLAAFRSAFSTAGPSGPSQGCSSTWRGGLGLSRGALLPPPPPPHRPCGPIRAVLHLPAASQPPQTHHRLSELSLRGHAGPKLISPDDGAQLRALLSLLLP